MLKSYGVVVVVGGPCDFSVSPWSKSFFFPFWGTYIQIGGLLGQGPGLGLGPGLDNKGCMNAMEAKYKHWGLNNFQRPILLSFEFLEPDSGCQRSQPQVLRWHLLTTLTWWRQSEQVEIGRILVQQYLLNMPIAIMPYHSQHSEEYTTKKPTPVTPSPLGGE